MFEAYAVAYDAARNRLGDARAIDKDERVVAMRAIELLGTLPRAKDRAIVEVVISTTNR